MVLAVINHSSLKEVMYTFSYSIHDPVAQNKWSGVICLRVVKSSVHFGLTLICLHGILSSFSPSEGPRTLICSLTTFSKAQNSSKIYQTTKLSLTGKHFTWDHRVHLTADSQVASLTLFFLGTSATHIVCEEAEAPRSRTQMPSTYLESSDLQHYPLGFSSHCLSMVQPSKPSPRVLNNAAQVIIIIFYRTSTRESNKKHGEQGPHNLKVTRLNSAGLVLDKSEEFQLSQTGLHTKSAQYFCSSCALGNLCHSGFPINPGTSVLC